MLLGKTKTGDPIVVARLDLTFSQTEWNKITKAAKRSGMTVEAYIQAVVRRQVR